MTTNDLAGQNNSTWESPTPTLTVHKSPRRKGKLKKSCSDSRLFEKPSVWGVVSAVHALDDDDSVYAEKIEKYVLPEFKPEILLCTPEPVRKKLQIPMTTGRSTHRLPKMNQVPSIFDILVSPKENNNKYVVEFPESDRERLRQIFMPTGDEDDVSDISCVSKQKSRSRPRKRLDKSGSDRSLSSKGTRRSSRKLKKSNSSPSLTFSEDKVEKSTSRQSSRNNRRSSSNKGTRRLKKSSSNKTLSESKSSSKKLLRTKLRAELVENEGKLKKFNSDRSLLSSKAASRRKKNDKQHKRRKSSSMLWDLESDADAPMLALQTKDKTRRKESLSLQAGPDAYLQEGRKTEDRMKAFVQKSKRESLEQQEARSGEVDGFRCVMTNDRRFSSEWSKVTPTPPKETRKLCLDNRPDGARLPTLSAL